MQAIRIEAPKGQRFPVERDQDITASVCGALFGENDYTTEFQLYHTLANGALPGKPSKLAQYGNVLEHSVAQLLELEHGLTLEKEAGYWRVPKRRIGASLDYWCYRWGDEDREFPDGVPLDVKVVSEHAWRSRWGKGEIVPNQYVMQLQMQCGITNTKTGLLGCLIAGADTKVIEVPFSQKLFDELMDRIDAFWLAIKEKREPLPHPIEDLDVILKLYRRATTGKAIDLSQDNAAVNAAVRFQQVAAKLKALDAEARELSGLKDELKGELLLKVKDAETAICGPVVLSAKSISRKGYSVQPSEYRTLKVETKHG